MNILYQLGAEISYVDGQLGAEISYVDGISLAAGPTSPRSITINEWIKKQSVVDTPSIGSKEINM